LVISLFVSCHLTAGDFVVKEYKYSGFYPLSKPFLADSLDVNAKKFSEKELIKTTVPFTAVTQSHEILSADSSGELVSPSGTGCGLHLFSFTLLSDRYTDGTLNVITDPDLVEVYINNKKQALKDGKVELTLQPWGYTIVLKCLSAGTGTQTIKCHYIPKTDAIVTASVSRERLYTLNDVTDGKRIQSASISPDGKYIITTYLEVFPGGDKKRYSEVTERISRQMIARYDGSAADIRWMPRSNRFYYIRRNMEGRELVSVDPATHLEVVLSTNLPEGNFRFSPTEDYLLFTIQEKGPEERKDLQQILEPDDRQPGWRNRSFIHKYDLATGVLQRLTYGYTSTFINDVSADGRYLLFSCMDGFLTERPFRRLSLYCMDLQTMQTDTLFKSAKFINRALFSPDARQLLIAGSGDAFEGIGLDINEGQISNTSDGQLFLYDLSDKSVIPLTQTFNPSVERQVVWNKTDNQIYFLAKDQDYVRLYTLKPGNKQITALQVQEDIVQDFDIAAAAPEMVYFGMSISNSNRLYSYNTKKHTFVCIADLSTEILKDVRLGETHDWNFVSEAGDTIYGRYYLPPSFDPAKKYPLIVNYYGGTTPIGRGLESRYPAHVYAGLGFVVYILQPSGATGFGQEFSARHVNAWGKRTADEIIEDTKKFCETHSFINKEKVGCMGASYGGFMTMYLQTKTDIYAAAMSHAGISDITSYWGEGYWGYSYSALASADSYPWNTRDMYTLQSLLFSADKINTPILFLHGVADTNVPIGESIQMFTALKLLGKPTVFVQVEGEDHHILDYDKRIRWNHTIYAWFAKWLKDQPEWWDALYSPKSL
ncbi:MAG: prolyl oligopeptidase family serine peptidase, partial [Tannerellaceae bacterium]|nr:prolyl oligopeptidase family serine peptidase [Tannerellaceae bacterium]